MNCATLKECDCPVYVSRCAHVDRLRVWLVTKSDAGQEYERRTGKRAAESCVGCGRAFGGPRGATSVYGPGILDPAGPNCPCRVELLTTTQRITSETLEGATVAFEAAVAGMCA